MFECEDASILLPQDAGIIQQWPRFSAKFDTAMIAVDLFPDEIIWEAQREEFDFPLPWSPDCDMSIVRCRPIIKPYSGYERIVQIRVVGTENLHYTWDVALDADGRKAMIKLFEMGSFTHLNDDRSRIIGSFTFKRS